MPISRSKEGRCAVSLVCLTMGRSDGITILGDLLATYLPYFMCSMPIAVKTPTGPIVAHVLLLARGCASWHRNRVLQSAEPKEAVLQRESLEFMSHEATGMRLAVSGRIWIRSSAESAVVVLSHTWLTASSSHGAENNGARQQRCRRTVGETRLRGSPQARDRGFLKTSCLVRFPVQTGRVRFQDEKQLAGMLPGVHLAISTIPGML
jgi:hypothetical protein